MKTRENRRAGASGERERAVSEANAKTDRDDEDRFRRKQGPSGQKIYDT